MSTPQMADAEEPFSRVDVPTAKQLIDEGNIQVIDVREPNEYAEGHIPGVTLVPLNTFLMNPREHLKGDRLLFVCATGPRSAVACEMAAAVGATQVYNLEGGTTGWAKAGLPIER